MPEQLNKDGGGLVTPKCQCDRMDGGKLCRSCLQEQEEMILGKQKERASRPEPEHPPAPLGFDREAEKANPPGVEWTRKAVWSLRMSLVEGVNALCDRADAAEAKLGDFEFSLGVSDEACVRALNERDGQKARADALEQERDRLKEALERYGVHDATCDKVMAIELDPENNEEAPCSCGLLAALAAAGGEGASDA